MDNTNRFNDLSIMKEAKLIPGNGLIKYNLESNSSKLRDGLVNQITKGDGPEVPHGRGFITFGNKCNKSSIEGPNDSTIQSGVFNDIQNILPNKIKKSEDRIPLANH